ncbi:MAG: hypothetical protein V3V78_02665 [Candidatus Woesearchaeota archaeon]
MVNAGFHVHTKEGSDGLMNFGSIIHKALEEEYRYITITDHDRLLDRSLIDEYNRFMRKNKKPECILWESRGLYKLVDPEVKMYIIGGIELSARYQGKEIHIMGQFMEEADEELELYLGSVNTYRYIRNREMVQNLQNQDIPLKWEDVDMLTGKGPSSRFHIGLALYISGLCPDCDSAKEAMQKYVGEGETAFIPFDNSLIWPVEKVIKKINDLGGISIWAHPDRSQVTNLEEAILDFKEAGLMGLENHNSYLASKHNLLFIEGNDFHGEQYAPGVQLGKDVSHEMVDSLLEEYYAIQHNELNEDLI